MRHEFIYNGMNSRDFGLRISGEDTWTETATSYSLETGTAILTSPTIAES